MVYTKRATGRRGASSKVQQQAPRTSGRLSGQTEEDHAPLPNIHANPDQDDLISAMKFTNTKDDDSVSHNGETSVNGEESISNKAAGLFDDGSKGEIPVDQEIVVEKPEENVPDESEIRSAKKQLILGGMSQGPSNQPEPQQIKKDAVQAVRELASNLNQDVGLNELSEEERKKMEVYQKFLPEILNAMTEAGYIISKKEESVLLSYLINYSSAEITKLEPFLLGYRAGSGTSRSNAEDRLGGVANSMEGMMKEMKFVVQSLNRQIDEMRVQNQIARDKNSQFVGSASKLPVPAAVLNLPPKSPVIDLEKASSVIMPSSGKRKTAEELKREIDELKKNRTQASGNPTPSPQPPKETGQSPVETPVQETPTDTPVPDLIKFFELEDINLSAVCENLEDAKKHFCAACVRDGSIDIGSLEKDPAKKFAARRKYLRMAKDIADDNKVPGGAPKVGRGKDVLSG